MPKLRRLSRAPRLLLALAVGGAIFGITAVVQASIPDANGVIHGCHNTSRAHGTPIGQLRVIDTAKVDGHCATWEAPLNWNAKGVTGATGPTGPTGPAGPTSVASGIVLADGTVQENTTLGPLPTITHPGPGQYGFSISGLGTRCVLPQLTGFAANYYLYYNDGACGAGFVTTTVLTSNGLDEQWSYLVVGDPAGARPSGKISLPKR